jgi:hypothetical protein
MLAENNDKTRDDSQDFNKSKIELKKPMSAGRYHEMLGELQKIRMLLAECRLKFSKLFKSDLYSLYIVYYWK